LYRLCYRLLRPLYYQPHRQLFHQLKLHLCCLLSNLLCQFLFMCSLLRTSGL
jgi:hypothetical protein